MSEKDLNTFIKGNLNQILNTIDFHGIVSKISESFDSGDDTVYDLDFEDKHFMLDASTSIEDNTLTVKFNLPLVELAYASKESFDHYIKNSAPELLEAITRSVIHGGPGREESLVRDALNLLEKSGFELTYSKFMEILEKHCKGSYKVFNGEPQYNSIYINLKKVMTPELFPKDALVYRDSPTYKQGMKAVHDYIFGPDEEMKKGFSETILERFIENNPSLEEPFSIEEFIENQPRLTQFTGNLNTYCVKLCFIFEF